MRVITKEQIAEMFHSYEIQCDSEELHCFGTSLKLKTKSIFTKILPNYTCCCKCLGNVNICKCEVIWSQTENYGNLFI